MLSHEISLGNLLPSERSSLKTLPGFGLSKGSKSCPLRSSQIFFAMEDGILTQIPIPTQRA